MLSLTTSKTSLQGFLDATHASNYLIVNLRRFKNDIDNVFPIDLNGKLMDGFPVSEFGLHFMFEYGLGLHYITLQ